VLLTTPTRKLDKAAGCYHHPAGGKAANTYMAIVRSKLSQIALYHQCPPFCAGTVSRNDSHMDRTQMKKKTNACLSLLLPLVLATLPASTALITVADLGGEPAAPYLDAVNGKSNEFTPPQSLSSSEPPASLSVSTMLPVSTPEMTPGVVVSVR
jgi:hypothetical protein